MIKKMFFLKLILFFIMVTIDLINATKSVGVKKLNNCKAKLDDGSIIDINSVDNPNNPL